MVSDNGMWCWRLELSSMMTLITANLIVYLAAPVTDPALISLHFNALNSTHTVRLAADVSARVSMCQCMTILCDVHKFSVKL